jgi:5-methylcytosine-specific restriction endonuclease McrA
MKWKYRCPKCGEWRNAVDWEERGSGRECGACQATYVVPRPNEQPQAFVDTHHWPQEMENAVVAAKGRKCTAFGCTAAAQTLDHRVPFSKGGRTSVANLFPMCNACNQEKSDTPFAVWDAQRKARARAVAAAMQRLFNQRKP